MSNDKQNPLGSKSSLDSTASSKASGSADAEQSRKEDGAVEPGRASEQKDAEQASKENSSAESGKGSKSKDAEQTHEDKAPTPAAKYGIDMHSGRLTSIVGDNPSVTINYYVEVVQGKRIKASKDSGDDGTGNKIFSDTDQLISENLALERQGTTFFTGSESKVGITKLPETEEEISQWYYGLSDYEQCYVQAAAVLHGAPAHEISKRADSLYKSMREQVEKPEPPSQSGSFQEDQRETQPRDTARFSDTLLRRIPSRELRAKTHTITRRVEGVERLYWQDVDLHGLSTFGFHLLAFLSNEFINRGEHGQNFLKVLEQWSEENSNEVSWRAARSYGAVLWYHSTDELSGVAEKWAKMNSLRSRRRTAELLDGAYEIERVRDDTINDGRTSSVVLRLLDKWVARLHSQFSIANANLGSSVASTYGLIGKRSPEIALAGLERLLQLPQSRSSEGTRSIFAAGVSTYVTLTWSGHVRNVLDHLASNAEHLSHQRSLPSKAEERQQYRRQREVRLNATLEAFFLIVATSLTEARNSRTVYYSLIEPLPQHPAIPDPSGRDVLLAGLLSASDVRENIATLLCAAIVEKKSRPAFGLLQRWAEVVLETRGTQDKEAEEIYLSFRQFLLNLGKKVDKWCLDLEEQGLRSPQAVDVYRNRLEQWCVVGRYRSHPIASLAQEVLKQLNN